MELNQNMHSLFELMSTSVFTDPEQKKKLETQYAEVTSRLSPTDDKVFNQLFKQFLQLKLQRVDTLLDKAEQELNLEKNKPGLKHWGVN